MDESVLVANEVDNDDAAFGNFFTHTPRRLAKFMRIGEYHSDADIHMTDDDEAAAYSDSDESTELGAYASPLDDGEIAAGSGDDAVPERTANNDSQVC